MASFEFYRTKGRNIFKKIEVLYHIQPSIKYLKSKNNPKTYSTRKIPVKAIDDFLFSGKYNSVCGPNGFVNFKLCLKDVLSKINDNSFSENLINLDKMFEALLESGLYINEDFLPEDFKNSRDDIRWLTAYRYITKNFPKINYKDFRTIVLRFQETRGYSFYIDKNDSKFLQSFNKLESLFEEMIDLKADLLQLNMSELKKICEKISIQPARSLNETADRIIDSKIDIASIIPNKTKDRKNLLIKDLELASGEDIIKLDKYLRELSKFIRKEFTEYILSRRKISFLQE